MTDLLTPGSVPTGRGGDWETMPPGELHARVGKGLCKPDTVPLLCIETQVENWDSLWALMGLNLSPWLPGVTPSVFVHLLGHQMRKPLRRWRFCVGGCPLLET